MHQGPSSAQHVEKYAQCHQNLEVQAKAFRNLNKRRISESVNLSRACVHGQAAETQTEAQRQAPCKDLNPRTEETNEDRAQEQLWGSGPSKSDLISPSSFFTTQSWFVFASRASACRWTPPDQSGEKGTGNQASAGFILIVA